MMSTLTLPDPLVIATAHFVAQRCEAYLVGGRVRDWLLGRETADTDLAVPEGALDHARAIARAGGGAFVMLDAQRDVGRVVWPDSGPPQVCLDIARFTGPGILEDLARRDFTIDALALPLASALPPRPPNADERAELRRRMLDPTGGLVDLDEGRIRMSGPGVFDEDPLRLLRAARLAAELGFTIVPATAAAIRAGAARIRLAAGERVRDELLRIIAAAGAARQMRQLDALDLLGHLLPEVPAGRGVQQGPPHDRDVFDHTLGVLAGIERVQALLAGDGGGAVDADTPLVVPAAWDAILADRRERLLAHFAEPPPSGVHGPAVWQRVAALLHDIGKPPTRFFDADQRRNRFPGHDQVGAAMVGGIADRLRLSRGAHDYLGTVVRHHMRPLNLMLGGDVSDRAVYRYFAATGPAGVDIAVLALADNAAKGSRGDAETTALAQVVDRLFDAWFDEHPRVVAPPPLVGGHDLMRALGLPPGPEVGRLLAAIREAQAAGDVSDVAGALALATSIVDRPLPEAV